MSVTYLSEWMKCEWALLNSHLWVNLLVNSNYTTHVSGINNDGYLWESMWTCTFVILKLEVHCLRYLMQFSFIYSDWEFRHVYYILHGCAWTLFMLWPLSYDDIFVHAKAKMDILYIFVRMLQHCRIKTENEFQCVLFMYHNSYHKKSILMMIKKFSWLFKRKLPEVNLCIWEFGVSHFTYIEILGTVCDYVIWLELKMLLTISKSIVEFWVGCYMSAATMRACMHAFTSQNGINAFGVRRLGVEVWGISTFNSTQCLYSWMILVIYPYMDEIYGSVHMGIWSFPLYICWDYGNHLWLCDLMGAEVAVNNQ